jgi:Ca-activated chloride channel family protein
VYPILQNWFAHPALLAALAAAPVLTVLFFWAWLRRRRALAALGMRRHALMRHGMRRWRGFFLLTGVALLALACAGPQWGREPADVRDASDDLVVVLDLSRSMQAEQPSRRERAVRLLRDLADVLEQRGGRRLALVVFAAEARLLFPLTQDYDHFRHALKQIEMDDLPPLLPAPDAPFHSGTRFGAALRMAVEANDAAHAGRQAILLLSDGDDPAADDEEWLQGVLAARAKGIRIHTVAVGEPDKPHTIPDGSDVLRHGGKVVITQVDEALMQEMARRTGGAYIPAHTYSLPLGTIVQNLLMLQPADSAGSADDSIFVYRQRYVWFLAPALALLLLSLLMNEGPAARRHTPTLAAGMIVLLASAGMPPDAEPLVREGNAAFSAGDYPGALEFYDRAELGATDPGMVAFNRAAACYRLGRFAEAAAGYRQCLEDDLIPASRRSRAHYDLGTALVKQSDATSAPLLRQAVSAFRACLAQPGLDGDLHADARHNLELAQMLWLKARAANPNDPPENGGDDQPPDKQPKKSNGPDKDRKGNDPGGAQGDPDKTGQPGNAGPGAAGKGNKDKIKPGDIQFLPDADRVVQLPPEETDAHLDGIIERILQERRAYWQKSAQAPKDARNW